MLNSRDPKGVAGELRLFWEQSASPSAFDTKYGRRIDGREPTNVWLIEVIGEPAGFAQSYRYSDHPQLEVLVGVSNAAGIDYLLNESHRGRGMAEPMLSAFADFVLDLYPKVEACVATPAVTNERSRRALEAAGFVYSHDSYPPDGPVEAVHIRCRPHP